MSSVLDLQSHPDGPRHADRYVRVLIERGAGRSVTVRWRVWGASVGAMAFPAPDGAGRTDGLWQATCFELFVRAARGEGYREYNLAPSGNWAAYDFTGYRAGQAAAPVPAPSIAFLRKPGWVELAARLTLPDDGRLRFGASAVIADADGGVGYWALAHPQGAADFHDAACFAAELAAPSGS